MYNTFVPGLVVFLENDNVSEWFNEANVTDEKEFSNVIITKKNVTQIEVSFKSGKNKIVQYYLFCSWEYRRFVIN